MVQCPSLIRVRFYLETIYFFSVQFSLNELNTNHFLIFEIFVKISSLKSLATYHSENRKKIPIILEFNENFSQDEFNNVVRFIIRDIENFLGFPELFWQFIIINIILPFLKISNFPGFTFTINSKVFSLDMYIV